VTRRLFLQLIAIMAFLKQLSSIQNSELLHRAMLLGYGLFFAGFFLIPRDLENYHQGFYYSGLALVGLVLLPRGWSLLRTNLVFWLFSVYLLYMAASGFWSEAYHLDPEAAKRTITYLKRAGYIIVFFLLTAAIRDHNPRRFDKMLMVVCVAAAVSSIITLWLWYRTHTFPESRVWGFSLVRWTIFAAYSFGVFAVLSLHFMIAARHRWLIWAMGLAFLILFGYVWLSQSRMALGATVLGMAVVMLGSRKRDWMWGLLVMGLVIGVSSVVLIPDTVDYLFSRGLSFRPDIWKAYIARGMDSPLFGEGILSDRRNFVSAPPLRGLVPDAHSAYVGTFRDGGLVGVLLLVGACLAALWRGVTEILRSASYISLALALEVVAFIATDTDRLITRTGGQWVFLWLPMVLVMTAPAVASRRTDNSRPDPDPESDRVPESKQMGA